ncbi:MAG: YkgJ family cysteine cluster protein [Prolixibacteraceae bacterium]|jgi:Fe-S-cluster containining protein|nr:YkgJ family cysteine cluster protein [Prolixibacteraceae bacterium]
MRKILYRKPEELKQLVKQDQKAIEAFFKQLKKNKPKDLDQQFHVLHKEAFDQFDCLDCANCCSSISPIVTQSDIDRLAKHLKVKAADILRDYLYMDEDGDFVFTSTPCPFLGADNYCRVYEGRPKACREYPHTDRRKIGQILDLTKKNCEYCPVVFEIVNELKNS